MIAVITSTLFVNGAYSFFSNDERLAQTIKTIETLDRLNFSHIYLFDNSLKSANWELLLTFSPKLKIFHTPQYTFKNKGLSEALLVLNNLQHLPDDTPLFKISGRYYPILDFIIPDFGVYPRIDFIGIGKILNEKIPFVSTRAYFVKNKLVLEGILVTAIEEMLSYSRSIHGIRSLYESIVLCLRPYVGTKYQLSLEQAVARILKINEKFHLLEHIGIEGYIAGSEYLEKISE